MHRQRVHVVLREAQSVGLPQPSGETRQASHHGRLGTGEVQRPGRGQQRGLLPCSIRIRGPCQEGAVEVLDVGETGRVPVEPSAGG